MAVTESKTRWLLRTDIRRHVAIVKHCNNIKFGVMYKICVVLTTNYILIEVYRGMNHL